MGVLPFITVVDEKLLPTQIYHKKNTKKVNFQRNEIKTVGANNRNQTIKTNSHT